jgi:hypothetical protein
VPQLGGNEEFFSFDALFKAFLECLTDDFFVLVLLGGVNVSVSRFHDGSNDRLFGFDTCCTKANDRHFLTIVELKGLGKWFVFHI